MPGVRIGVVADTHVGEFLAAAPAGLGAALAGCDLILHAGDLSGAGVLEALERIAPVVAVRGDHDLPDAPVLPHAVVVAVAGITIGLTHGGGGRVRDALVLLDGVLHPRGVPALRTLARRLVRTFGPVDLVVHGHWHRPTLLRVGRTLVFSPGAVCPWGSLEGGCAPRPGAAGAVDRIVRRYRRRLGDEAMRPRVGIIEVDAAGVRVRSVPLALGYPSAS